MPQLLESLFRIKRENQAFSVHPSRITVLFYSPEHPVYIDSSFSVDKVWRSLFVDNLELQPRLRIPPLEIYILLAHSPFIFLIIEESEDRSINEK